MAPSRGRLLSKVSLRAAGRSPAPTQCQFQQAFTTAAVRLSGHNRWSKIRHDKAKVDASKNRQRSMFSHEITSASKFFGPEPKSNPRLADLITKAKKEGFAKASIEAAIARGQGKSISGANLENVTVEGMLPGNIGVIVECETDSRLRTLAEVRLVLKDAGGSVSPTAFLFAKRGRIIFEGKGGVSVEEVLEAALDAGATDVVENTTDGAQGDGVVVFCEPGDTKAVGSSIAKSLGLQIKTSEIMWAANEDTRTFITGEDAARELCGFVDELQEREASVQTVAMNVGQGSLSSESWRELQSRLSA